MLSALHELTVSGILYSGLKIFAEVFLVFSVLLTGTNSVGRYVPMFGRNMHVQERS
jgi:hypothetical protein